jgi:hypothetical protein
MLGGRRILRLFVTALAVAALAGASSGCTRSLYRRQADREAHYLIREKSLGTPWAVPDSFTIAPDQRSRFFDATSADFPTLPPAGPSLYQYQLPMRGAGRSLSPATRSGLEQRRSPEGAIPPVDDPEMLPPSPVTRSPNVPRGQTEATPATVSPVVYRPVHAGRSASSTGRPVSGRC